MITQRQYQNDCRASVATEFKEVNSTLVVIPTGCGKTIVFAAVANDMFPRRTMVLAHRQELIWQAKQKIESVTGLAVEVEMGEFRANQSSGLFGRAHIVVSSIQTHVAGGDGAGRMGKFDPMDFSLLIIDEAHHATASSYRRIIDYYRTNPKLKVLGVTATPDRVDEIALGQVFETVAYDYEILDAIHDGWLVPIDQQMVHVEDLDFSNVRSTAGDLNGADLAAIMEQEKNLQGVAGPTMEIIGDRRALVFTASVKHAETLSSIFNRHRAGMSAWVCGKTDKDERNKINADFDSGKIQILCNCGTHTEGYDSPGVEVVIMAKPTKSRSLYAQMIGRSTRPLPGIVDGPETPDERREAIASSRKPSCLVVDFVGNSGKHKLVTTADILGGKASEEAIDRATMFARKTGKPVRMNVAIDEQEEILREEKRLAEEARKNKIVAKSTFSTKFIDPFDVLSIKPQKPRGWDSDKVLTEKQNAFLRKFGVDPDGLEYAPAKQLIGEIMHRLDAKLCTLKQAKILKKYGYDVNMSYDQAHATIDALAANGWRKPANIPQVAQDPVLATGADDGEIPF